MSPLTHLQRKVTNAAARRNVSVSTRPSSEPPRASLDPRRRALALFSSIRQPDAPTCSHLRGARLQDRVFDQGNPYGSESTAAQSRRSRDDLRAPTWRPSDGTPRQSPPKSRSPSTTSPVIAGHPPNNTYLLTERKLTQNPRAQTVRETLAQIIPERQALLKEIKSQHGAKTLGNVTVEQVIGGGRGIKYMLWDPSVLDAEEGIRFWGRSIPECQRDLPTAEGGKEILPEAMFWYLLTGKVPTAEETKQFQEELVGRSELPAYVEKVLDSLPKTLHPMTQFVIGVAALNHDSKFAAQYKAGMKKSEYWVPALEDSLDCVAKSFTLAARIYNNIYRNGHDSSVPAIDKSKDLSFNFANQIGFGDSEGFVELIRLYNSLHTDHEGGNVSAHTTHLVGSALSDPFLSYSAALGGLAGPLHGLANQEVLRCVARALSLGDD